MSTTALSSSSSATAAPTYGLPDILPPTHSTYLTSTLGDLALYNGTLLSAAAALFQHTAVFGILFLLRGFSPKRALDLHYLTIVFALSFVAAPLVFLLDLHIDQIKLLFFLEHEAVEYLIAIRVFAPAKFVARRSGLIVLACWCSLVLVTIPVVLDPTFFHHAADIVAWSAFGSDFLLGLTGLALIRRWSIDRPATRLVQRKLRAEALAGLGFALHGFITMSIGPIFALVLYNNLSPAYFAYAWVAVFLSAFFAVGLSVPCAGLFFSNVRWCCTHRKAVFPGQAEWYEEVEKEDYVEPAPRYAAHPPARAEPWSPTGTFQFQWPEEQRSSMWRDGRSGRRTQRWTGNNIYYREVLKDLLAK